jgi:hypothetical protein
MYKYNELQMFGATQKLSYKANFKTPFFFFFLIVWIIVVKLVKDNIFY